MRLRLFKCFNLLYSHCYPLYAPLYKGYKVWSDRYERTLFRKGIQPGMVVVDIGANIGIYTIFFARLVGIHGKVLAFEPDPKNFKFLKKNVAQLSQVIACHAAVGSSSGSIALYLSPELNVDHQIFDAGDARKSIEVPLFSLDDYFQSGRRIDWIKLDVQGAELMVLQGAQRTIRENPQLKIVMEFSPYSLDRANTSPIYLLEFIRSLGLEIYVLENPEKIFIYEISVDYQLEEMDYCNLMLRRPKA
ncbi:fkbM_fam, methyltransferase, FkbM family [Burkholderiaceae bacterium]